MGKQEDDVWRLPPTVRGEDVRLADMPVALTRRQAMAVELRRVLEQQGGRGTPASAPSPAAEVLHGARPRDADQPKFDLPDRPSRPQR